MLRRSRLLNRRQCILGGLTLTAIALTPARAQNAPEFRTLRAKPGRAALRPEGAETAIWGFDGTVPGPTLRVKRGEELRVRLINELPDTTTIHWHGLRLPNAMDGVPHLTQKAVEPGASFDYRFVAPDAGTFWYHPHQFSSEQVDRGLYGLLIVDEPVPIDVDHDIALTFDDWRLRADNSIDEASFRSMHDAAHDGRLGQHFTVNGKPSLDIPVKTNERLRLRLVNVANARIMSVRIDEHPVTVIAIDGQPAEPFAARDGRLILGPGNRADVIVDATLEAGTVAPIVVHDMRREIELARLVYDKAPGRPNVRGEIKPLPANPLPARMDFKAAFRMDIPIEGGAMSAMMRGGMMHGPRGDGGASVWTMAGNAASGHDGPPLFSVKRGRTVMLAFANNTAFPHAMHIHGHHFRLLDRLDDGWKPYWLDTLLVDTKQTSRIAFVADNPGKWMIHCHMLEHQETGMGAWFEVS